MPSVKFKDDITPMLKSLDASLKDMKGGLKEVGEFMASTIKTRMREQRGVGKSIRYRKLSPQYAKRKQKAGFNPSRVLYRTGRLGASWRRLRVTKASVYVGAAGPHEADKAEWNDDRLDVAWNDRFFSEAGGTLLDAIYAKVK